MTIPSAFTALLFLLAFQSVHAQELLNKSTFIAGSKNPENGFIVCAVGKALSQSYGQTRKVIAYTHSAPVGGKTPPESVIVRFVTETLADNKRHVLQLELKSTEPVKKWQFLRTSTGQSYFYSKLVSPTALLKELSLEPIEIDISDCN